MVIHHVQRVRRTHQSNRGAGRPRGAGLAAPLGAAIATVLALGMLLAPSAPLAGAATAPAQGFTSTEAPLPVDANASPATYLSGASCPAQNACTQVGWYNDAANNKPWGLIETQNATGWADTEAPQPADSGTGTNQGFWFGSSSCGFAAPCRPVSCPTTSFCVAVGEYIDAAAHPQAVIDTEVNGTWTSMTAALPADAATDATTDKPTNWLFGVSCASATSCVAVGRYVNTSGNGVGLVDTLSGTTWTGTVAPLPAGANPTSSLLSGVSCGTPTTCTAVGQYAAAIGGQLPLLLTLANGSWTPTSGPMPADARTGSGQDGIMIQVSCASSSACVGVGFYINTASNVKPLLEVWDGATWTGMAGPLPADAVAGSDDQFTAVSCATAASCVAVGTYVNTAGQGLGLIDWLAGGTWHSMAAPLPANALTPGNPSAQLNEISCPTPAFCMSVGTYVATGSVDKAMVDTYSGGSWSALAAPLPANASGFAAGRTVACNSPVSCTVGGQYDDPGVIQGFLDTFTGLQGYWLSASDGGIFSYGNAQFYGSRGGQPLNKPIVGMAASPDGQGYWFVASDGGIFNYGDAGFFGSAGSLRLNKPVVGMAATADGKGYWLVASDGGIFTYGDAGFFGSAGSLRLNKPVVGMASTPDGQGYWLVASDGGIFTYGDAAFYGSTGGIVLNKPVVGMAATPSGLGYWLVASDGGIFNYGDAGFFGSAGSLTLNKPVVGMASSPSGHGYWLVATDGGIFNYGDALFYGSAGALPLVKPVVGMAA